MRRIQPSLLWWEVRYEAHTALPARVEIRDNEAHIALLGWEKRDNEAHSAPLGWEKREERIPCICLPLPLGIILSRHIQASLGSLGGPQHPRVQLWLPVTVTAGSACTVMVRVAQER